MIEKCSILGPFAQTSNVNDAVDFSVPITNSYLSVVLPLKYDSKMWFIFYPLEYEVWLFLMISVPIYLLAMAFANYIFYGNADLHFLTGFILRSVLSDHNGGPGRPTKIYEELLMITWILSMFVLVSSYAGNLTAILAKPRLGYPIRTLEGLLDQSEIPWVIEKDGQAASLLKSSPSGSLLKQLYDGATFMSRRTTQEMMLNGCYSNEIKQKGEHGAVCFSSDISVLMLNDYSKTGRCNYYVIEDKFFTSGSFMAFQVIYMNF